MNRNIIISRKAAIIIVSISLFMLGFQILNVNIPDDIDITSGISSAAASIDAAPQPKPQAKQVDLPQAVVPAAPPPPLPPIDLIALRIKRTEDLARMDYERMRHAQQYISKTPALPPSTAVKTFQTVCHDPSVGYFHCTVTQ